MNELQMTNGGNSFLVLWRLVARGLPNKRNPRNPPPTTRNPPLYNPKLKKNEIHEIQSLAWNPLPKKRNPPRRPTSTFEKTICSLICSLGLLRTRRHKKFTKSSRWRTKGHCFVAFVCFSFWLRVLDYAEYSAFESTLNSSIVSYCIVNPMSLLPAAAAVERSGDATRGLLPWRSCDHDATEEDSSSAAARSLHINMPTSTICWTFNILTVLYFDEHPPWMALYTCICTLILCNEKLATNKSLTYLLTYLGNAYYHGVPC